MLGSKLAGESIIVGNWCRENMSEAELNKLEKKIFDKDFYQDKANVVPDGLAFCIGNGPSRKGFTLEALRARGQTYACNAIYRDFIPDFIFSVDAQMTQEMVRAEVYKKCIHYAPSLEVGRHPYWRDSVLHLIP